ncbi:hypothetical protein QTP88_000790 [Uroleucon formosanum]
MAGLFVNYIDSLPNEEKVSILNNVWTPDPNFIFPTQSCAKFKRQLQIKWLNTFKWLAYSKCKEGVFCKYYVLFLNQNQVGKEQFSICIRYFEQELVVLLKDFLTFVPVHDVTGLGLATVLLNTLKELGLDLDKLRRHGYDGAASMSISVCVLSKLLSYTYHLSEYLQTKYIDLVNAPDRVNQVTIQLKILRYNATNEFNKIYEEVNRLGGLINVEESMPRICDSQRNRQNVPFQNTQEFYRRAVFIPHLDGIHLSLDKRILSHHEIINSRQFVLPNMIVDKPYSNLKTAVTFYQNDLKGYDDIIEDEYQLWQSKWNLVESRPSTAIEALQQCDQLMYPNMYELLKILSILPVSTATAERSFSTLRRLKNYLRNTISESRLVGLALISIHRDVDITDDMVLDKFSNSEKARRLKSTI